MFGAYRLLERINVGGMAQVHRAVHDETGREVALKRLLPSVCQDTEVVEMFRDEAMIARGLDHENIVKIYDVGQVGEIAYMAMEHVDGRDMRTIMERLGRKGQRASTDLVMHVALSTCAGLQHAHTCKGSDGTELGLVHRDVSPQNIMVSFDGDVKIIDFGIARAKGKITETKSGIIKGKAGYMSPEQVQGLPLDGRSDIFALGICLWEFLTGQKLYYGNSDVEMMDLILRNDPPAPSQLNPSVPEFWDRIVARALAKNVDDRYHSASELYEQLRAYANSVAMVVQRDVVASFMRLTFFNETQKRNQFSEEAHAMADNKGGSDLDVFDGLGRNQSSHTAQSNPPGSGPGSMARLSGQGLPPLPLAAPPPRAKTLVGLMPPPSVPGALPPPSMPGLPPRSAAPGMLPPVVAPPSKTPSSAPAASIPASTGSGVLPPVSMPARTSISGHPSSQSPVISVEWEEQDEDEKTQVYDKQNADDIAEAIMQPLPAAGTPAPSAAAAALLQRSGNVAPPMSRPPSELASVPPPPASRPVAAAANQTVLQPPMQAGSSSLPWILVGFLIVLLGLGLGAYWFTTGPGELRVYVSGPNGRDIGQVDIYVDNQKQCSNSPCTISNLSPGIHDVRADAVGYAPAAPRGVTIKARSESKLDIELAVASSGSGLTVNSSQQGIRLFVDGAEIGPLPQTITTLAVGQHTVRFVGSERFEPMEKTITVVPGKIEDLGNIKLKVLKGKANFELVTKGARVLLVPSNGDKRQIGERMFEEKNPLPIDIDTSKQWTIEATKTGYEDYRQVISFEDGVVEKTYRIELVEKGKGPVATTQDLPSISVQQTAPTPQQKPATGPARKPVAESKPAEGGTSSSAPATAAAAKSGKGTLNINSIPPSKVLLDGRPLGQTPKPGVSVSAGSHTVTFVHPEKGRKVISVNVGAGETKTAAVKFD